MCLQSDIVSSTNNEHYFMLINFQLKAELVKVSCGNKQKIV